MIGETIDPNIFTVYRYRRVYFCCELCKSAFKKDPEKYLHRLPQFAGPASRGNHEHAAHEKGEEGFALASLIKPMGIVTLSLVAITVLLGLFRRWNPRLLLKWHKRFGPSALLSGVIHAALVLLAH